MKIFSSPLKFAEHLLMVAAKEYEILHGGLEIAATLIEKSAKKEIGHLQPEVGPFNAWDELADSTKEDKARKGYYFNEDYNPLLRTGELHDSISHEVEGLEAVIGSTSPIMVYQEFGTSSIPPRPVLGPAVYKNKEKIEAIIGSVAIGGFVGGTLIHPSLGYDMDSE